MHAKCTLSKTDKPKGSNAICVCVGCRARSFSLFSGFVFVFRSQTKLNYRDRNTSTETTPPFIRIINNNGFLESASIVCPLANVLQCSNQRMDKQVFFDCAKWNKRSHKKTEQKFEIVFFPFGIS